MGTWIKETDKAIYLMDGSYYRQKIEKLKHQGQVEGETFFRTQLLKEWLNSDEPPGAFLVSVGTGTDEPKPFPVAPPPPPPEPPTPEPPTPEVSTPEPPASQGITITKHPNQVKIYHPFQLAGTANETLAGQTVSLYVDNNPTAIAKTTVNTNNQWAFRSVVFVAVDQPKQRQLKVVAGGASDIASLTLTPYIENHPGPQKLNLQGSVGSRGRNIASDVKLVRERLVTLGYDFAKGSSINNLIEAIRLFQSAISGSTTLRGDGRVDVGGRTHGFLEAANAPQWMLMPGRGIGFYNLEVLEQTNDFHDYGLDWISNVIRAAGIHYERLYRKNRSSIAPIAVNDVSLPRGGKSPDHGGHQSGNAGDIALPKKGGDFGGTAWSSSNYDRNAAEAILKALRAQPWVNRRTIYFNDPVLINKGLCRRLGGHDYHIHFEITVPARL